MISHIITSTSATIVVNGKTFNVPRDDESFDLVKQALVDGDEEKLLAALDKISRVKQFVEDSYKGGDIEVHEYGISYKGEPLHGVIVDRILSLRAEGFPFMPMVKFLENLMQNPSARSVRELYLFLEHKDLPITEDGHFLAYKRVNKDFTDCYSGKVNNTVGTVNEIPRNRVDDDHELECSFGFHVGSMKYVANYFQGCPIVLVKVNPKDVVSVPSNECTKLRTCRYEVLSVLEGEQTLDKSLYSSGGDDYEPLSSSKKAEDGEHLYEDYGYDPDYDYDNDYSELMPEPKKAWSGLWRPWVDFIEDKEDMTTILESSLIDKVAYEPTNGWLYVKLTTGDDYVYNDVPPGVFSNLVDAPSPGKYYNLQIKDVYKLAE